MTLLTLLRHRLRALWRVPFAGRRVVSLLIGVFVALYLGGGLVLLGLVFDDLVREAAPGADPLLIVARWLLPFAVAYAAVRVMTESGLGADPRPYRLLPIRRDALVAFLAVWALFSLWNVVPLAFLVTVCAEAALSGAMGTALRLGLAGLGVLGAVTYAVPVLRQALSDRPFMAAGLVLVAVGSVAVEAVDVVGGIASLLDVSGWLLGGVVQGRVLPGAVSLVLLGAVGYGYARWLRGAMVLDQGAQDAGRSGASNDWLDRLARRGPAWREAVLETRLLLRNSQTRFTIFNVLLLVGLIVGLGFVPIELRDLKDSTLNFINLTFFTGLFGTGGIAVWHGQNLFSYEGRCFEGSTARPATAGHRVAGKCLFLAGGVLICFLLPLPILLWLQSPFLVIHGAFFLYNVGVLVPAVVAGATFNRKALAISETTLAQTNFSGVRAAVVLPLFGLPMIPILLFDSVLLRFGTIAALGAVSALAYPLWRRGLVPLYRRNRYAMMRGFRSSHS